MSNPQPKVTLVNTNDYRETYANSVNMRVGLWDFFFLFGQLKQETPEGMVIEHHQGVYMSPQQAKAFLNLLTQNVQQYEATFGEIRLEPVGSNTGHGGSLQ